MVLIPGSNNSNSGVPSRDFREPVADVVIDEIIQRFPKLAAFPDMGRKRDDVIEGLRSFPIKPYVLFYRRTQEGTEIFRILHGRRDIESELLDT